MIVFMKLTPIKATSIILRRGQRGLFVTLALLCMASMLAGCGLPVSLPTELPVDIPDIPGIPSDLGDLQGLLGELGIPDLSDLANVPGLEALVGEETPPGGISFQGPLEMSLAAGQAIPGTDIRFVEAQEGADAAQFEIAGFRAPRHLGDSLDYDGAWPGISGVTYHVRMRVYTIGGGGVRAAGVHRLVVENVLPQEAVVETNPASVTLSFPHTTKSDAGQLFPGMTLGYSGQQDRGATLTGLPQGEFPYRKIGDSVEWEGRLSANLSVVYHLRLLYYQDTNATMGGVVLVSLPGQ